LCQRCVGVPLQHLTGDQPFRRLTLIVRPGVFIPRSETEVVVELALAVVSGVAAPVVVDVGTGTGAIALTMKDERPDARVLAIDLSPEAVELARENATRSVLDVEVVQGDLLDPVPATIRGSVDLVVSNPPYVEPHELATLPREVLADPMLALAGGIEVYERLFAQAARVLRPGGAVVVEIGESQGSRVRAAATAAGFVSVEVEPDLNGRDRIVTGRAPA
jgi:release factor glutamine methyltransferase